MGVEAMSRHFFISNDSKSWNVSTQFTLEEELTTATEPGTELKKGKYTEEQKDEARARVLAKLKMHGGPVEGSWKEIRAALGLEDIDMELFQKSCWHLRKGDRDPQKVRRISVGRGEAGGIAMPRPFVIRAF